MTNYTRTGLKTIKNGVMNPKFGVSGSTFD